MKNKKAIWALLPVALLFAFASCANPEPVWAPESAASASQASASSHVSSTPAPDSTASAPAATPEPVPEPQYVSLLFAGDVMAHQKQVDSHRFGPAYDFTDDYTYIRDIVSAADIAVVNLETPMTGKGPYKGYPNFNAPDSLADALLYAGFDVVATANNHIRDQGTSGIIRTCAFLRGMGFEVIGTDSGEGGAKYALLERNGIKIGFVNFTKSLNEGFPEAAIPYVNCMRHRGGTEQGYLALGEEIAALKEMGAEFIVVYMHWGSEYQLRANATQEGMAQAIADLGADLIIGAHPHVLQNAAEYTSPVTGKTALIYYSLGNLVSNQPYSYGPGRGHCETGALALVRLKRLDGGSVAIDAAGYLTTYVLKPDVVHEYTVDGKTRSRTTRAYFIVPAAAVLANPADYVGAAGTLLTRVGQGAANGREILGESGAALSQFDFREYTAFEW